MALSSPVRALWLDGMTDAAQDLRLQTTSALLASQMPTGTTAIAARQGVRPSGNTAAGSFQVSAASGMTITVGAGVAFVQGTTAANSGMYAAVLDTAATLTVATADVTNPRIDNVVIWINDVGTSSSTPVVELQTGTPAPSPAAPALPANALLLATISVAAGTSTIIAANITDQRVFTVANGGIVPVKTLAPGDPMTADKGMYAHDLNTGRLRVADGAGNARQPKVAAFAAGIQRVSGNIATVVGSPTTMATVTVTCDGSTEVEVYGSWTALVPDGGQVTGDYLEAFLMIDGFLISNWSTCYVRTDSTNGNVGFGNSVTDWIVPSAGAHTFTLQAQSVGHAFHMAYPLLRVAPSLQQ